jgi:hypothetical protein
LCCSKKKKKKKKKNNRSGNDACHALSEDSSHKASKQSKRKPTNKHENINEKRRSNVRMTVLFILFARNEEKK